MDKELYEHLVSSGIEADKAGEIAKGFSVEGPAVDTDELKKAMEEIRDTFDKGDANSEEAIRLETAVEEAADIVDAVTKGADLILEEVRTQNAALRKGFEAIAEELSTLRAAVGSKVVSEEAVAKSLEDVKEAVAEPVVKSVGNDIEVVAAPGDGKGEGNSLHDVIAKALNEISTTEDNARAASLSQAVTLLESGADVHEITTSYGIN
jgi:hypothetical protein